MSGCVAQRFVFVIRVHPLLVLLLYYRVNFYYRNKALCFAGIITEILKHGFSSREQFNFPLNLKGLLQQDFM